MPERRRRLSGVFAINFEHILPCSNVCIVAFEPVIAGWAYSKWKTLCTLYLWGGRGQDMMQSTLSLGSPIAL